MRLIRRRGPTLSAFVEEWWALYAEPNLEHATTRTYRWVWESHARPHLGTMRLRDVTPLVLSGFRAELEAEGVGAESIRKTLTMLGSVFSRAVEWQLVESNPVRAARKPSLPRARTVPPIGPDLVEPMRSRLLERGRTRDALLLARISSPTGAVRMSR